MINDKKEIIFNSKIWIWLATAGLFILPAVGWFVENPNGFFKFEKWTMFHTTHVNVCTLSLYNPAPDRTHKTTLGYRFPNDILKSAPHSALHEPRYFITDPSTILAVLQKLCAQSTEPIWVSSDCYINNNWENFLKKGTNACKD